MGEIRPLARLRELRPSKHLVNCTQYYASTLQLNFSKLYHQLHNGSVHKQNNRRVIVTSSVWENLFYLLFAWQKKEDGLYEKQTDIQSTICPLKNLPNFRHFDDVVLNLRIHS